MTEQQKQDRMEIVYQASGQEVKLSPGIIQQFITKGNVNITQEEAVNFMQLCKYSELNPFLNEAYLIKYSNDRPADMVVSKEAIMKRANKQPDYNGFKAGVIIEKDGELVYRTGQFVTKKEMLLGGWAKVYRKGIEFPFEIEVSLSEYSTGKSTWNKMPGNMIRKVALVAALREAYPEQLGAMYSEEEPTISDLNNSKPVEPVKDEKTEELLNDFKKDVKPVEPIEEEKQPKEVEPIPEEETKVIDADIVDDYEDKTEQLKKAFDQGVLDGQENEQLKNEKGAEQFEQTGFFNDRTITPK